MALSVSSSSELLTSMYRSDSDNLVEILEIFPDKPEKPRKRGTLFRSLSSQSELGSTKEDRCDLNKILSHDKAFESFIAHLSRESMYMSISFDIQI